MNNKNEQKTRETSQKKTRETKQKRKQKEGTGKDEIGMLFIDMADEMGMFLLWLAAHAHLSGYAHEW